MSEYFSFQVQGVQEDAVKLLVAYSGDKAREIQDREAEVLNAWRNLQINMEYRKNILADTNDLFRFFNMVRDLMMWMDDMLRQMSNQEKPRYAKNDTPFIDYTSLSTAQIIFFLITACI